MTVDSMYTNLKYKIINECGNELNETNKLNDLKIQYTTDINSNRRLSHIQTVCDLIEILEKRYTLHPYNIEIFEHLIKSANKLTLLTDVNQYLKFIYKELNYVQQIERSPSVSESLETFSETQQRVIDILSRELGTHWRELSRFLNFQESEIDEIEKNNSFSGSIKKMLEIFLQRTDPNQVSRLLRNGLATIKRQDLVLKLYEMM